jgi:hypothetical protein
MSATRKTLKTLGIAHSAVRFEFSVDEWVKSYHPHSHAILSAAPSGKAYVSKSDWLAAWLSELPQWLHPVEGGSHVAPVRNLEGACRYFAKSPFRCASESTIGQILQGIEATKGLRRFATSGAFRYKN